ncbi:hypothetical protein GCM10009548_30710 [Streptomyces malaysiensis subsp. malaysiensis]|uniref:Uncharacterized protein n=1 Tax=Streptomyces malaysiensis TaxID=92644 RepID=A0A2J7YTY2_STRMQ|nr:hypothetical protein SMF913_26961 [Streptomyces malaysiensis]
MRISLPHLLGFAPGYSAVLQISGQLTIGPDSATVDLVDSCQLTPLTGVVELTGSHIDLVRPRSFRAGSGPGRAGNTRAARKEETGDTGEPRGISRSA